MNSRWSGPGVICTDYRSLCLKSYRLCCACGYTFSVCFKLPLYTCCQSCARSKSEWIKLQHSKLAWLLKWLWEKTQSSQKMITNEVLRQGFWSEYTPQHSWCLGHGTVWLQWSRKPRKWQWCQGSHRASSSHDQPSLERPMANLGAQTKSARSTNTNTPNPKIQEC